MHALLLSKMEKDDLLTKVIYFFVSLSRLRTGRNGPSDGLLYPIRPLLSNV